MLYHIPPFWLGYPDSNQEKQDQNLLCYHYTIAQTFGSAPLREDFRNIE